MEWVYFQKYWLSTEGYYFQYRPDKYDSFIDRATLYDIRNNIIDDVRVTGGRNDGADLTHFNVINHFEARLQMGIIPKKNKI
jgi:hypothetical protein